ncbi:hypothetical protein CB0940_06804, partial [Cercospora beticola]
RPSGRSGRQHFLESVPSTYRLYRPIGTSVYPSTSIKPEASSTRHPSSTDNLQAQSKPISQTLATQHRGVPIPNHRTKATSNHGSRTLHNPPQHSVHIPHGSSSLIFRRPIPQRSELEKEQRYVPCENGEIRWWCIIQLQEEA